MPLLGGEQCGQQARFVGELAMYEGTGAILREANGDVTIVKFAKPKITEEAYGRQAGAELKKIAQRVGGKILVDLSNVLFMSSVGISELITFNKDVRALGGHVKICSVSPLLRQVLASCGLMAVLDVHTTQREALDAFHTSLRAALGATAR